MRYYKIVTIGRRGGTSFQLKDATGRTVFGYMVLNSEKVRHEMEMDEPTYLKHAKALAQLCQFPGAAVYVAEIRDDGETSQRAPEVIEFEAGYNLAMDGRELPDDASPAARAGWELVKAKPPLVTVIDHSADEPKLTVAAVAEVIDSAYASIGQVPLAAITEKTPHFSIVAAAKREGVDISQCKTRTERVQAILAARVVRLVSITSNESAFAQL